MSTLIAADMPIRPAFWNVPLWGEIGVYVAGLAAVALLVFGVLRALERTKKGAAPDDAPRSKDGFRRMLRAVVFGERVSETPFGKVHAALVLGFFLLFLGTATATLDWDIGHYVFGTQFLTGNVYLTYKLVLDAAGVVVLAALAAGALRRYRANSTLNRSARFLWVYASLALVILTGYLVEGLRLAAEQPLWMDFSPVGSLIARALLAAGATPEGILSSHIVLWTVHGLGALAFIAAIPLTFYGHIYRAPVSILRRREAPLGRLPKIEAIEEQEAFGISRIEQLTESERLQTASCVECGRCNDVCPAVRAGTPLAPRTIVMKLRDRAERFARGEADDEPLVGGLVTHEELFSCTTCGACARACPAEIQTPDLIVKMRRHLALEEGVFPEGAATALENTASVGNPWGLDPYERLDWAKDLELPVAEPGVRYDVLYWVGCAASYDRRARRIARAMVKILRAANVHFAVMAEERCHAEFARRLGEEYLFQTAALENIANFSQYDFGAILTACPHCFNTLANEYPTFEGMPEKPVFDHASFIRKLINEGRLPALDKGDEATVYHDPCYLARLNGITEAPRALLEACAPALYPEAEGEKTFCCGAGGGRIWSDAKDPKPINIIRLDALRAAGAKRIAVACPHCLTMLESARATKNLEDLPILDLAEIVAASLDAPSPKKTGKIETTQTSAS